MIGPEIISSYRAKLTYLVSQTEHRRMDPVKISVWQAMSLLQKAIRRGQTKMAVDAASTLLVESPDRLWRRLGIIAFEDIGIADIETVGIVTAALGGKRIRAGIGDEWKVASVCVEALAAAKKCRATDDLFMVLQRHPALAEARDNYGPLSHTELVQLISGSTDLTERAVALCYLIGGIEQGRYGRIKRLGDPPRAIDLLYEVGTPMTVIELACEGYRRTREPICLLLGLLASNGVPQFSTTQDDDFPVEDRVGLMPGCALDMFTREGRAALVRFAAGDSATANWVKDRVPPSHRIALLNNLVFYAEGGLLRRRLQWPSGLKLRHQAEIECHGPYCEDASEPLSLLRLDLPLLQEERRRVS